MLSVCAQCAFRFNLSTARAVGTSTRRHIARAVFTRSISSSPSTSNKSTSTTPTPKPKAAVTSSVVAGTTLKGINYIKKLTDPIALPDEDYPQWLWKCLEDRRPQLSSTPQISAEDAADLYSKSKKRRKIAQKRIAAKEAAGGTVLDVPADHRTEDMPWETYEESSEARLEAKKASRARRRAAIKEKNFLGQLG